MQTRLILFEGVPFSGKSTQSEYAAEQLGRSGIEAEWVHEGAMLRHFFPHVLAILERTQTLSTALLRADWQGFVAAASVSPGAFVVDGALSFAAVWPLLAADLPETTIRSELRWIAETCAPLAPQVVHLVGDVARLARTSYTERGQGWIDHIVGQIDSFPYQQARRRSGMDGVDLFFGDAQALMERVLHEDGWRSLTLAVSAGDWEANRAALLSFLGVPAVASPPR